MTESKRKKILLKIKKQKVMPLAELVKIFGNRMEVSRKASEGLLQPLGNGYYASSELDPFVAALAVVAKFYPQLVISGQTALQIHGLAENYIERIDVDIERKKSLRNKMLHVHRVDPKKLVGVTRITYHGISLKIYDLERTLAEAYRLDPAGPDFYKALKRYLKHGAVKTNQIANYDQILKTKVMIHLQQELAND